LFDCEALKLTPFEFELVLYQPLFLGSVDVAFIVFKSYIDIDGRTVKLYVIVRVNVNHVLFYFSFDFHHSTVKLLTGHVQWTKTGTHPALTARAEPSSAIGETFETVADEMNGEKMNEKILETMNDKIGIKTKDVPFGTKSPRQLIADTELNDITVVTAVTKNNANGVVLDNVPPTNDDELNHLASGIACQERREECPLGKTGTTMFC